MNIKFFSILFMCFFSTFSFGQLEKECDPENTVGFIKICGEIPKEMKPGVQKIPLWQGTDYPGYQLIDCQKRTIKNVIESTGESYSCQVTGGDYSPVRSDKKLDEIGIVNSKEEKSPLIKVIQDSKSYDPDTCEWVEDMPRRIAHGPSCNVGGSKICVGHVVCKEKSTGLKMIRMSTCSPDHCGDNGAVNCTKEKGYSSTNHERNRPTNSNPSKPSRASAQ